jgi:GTP pyrophosphokinase
MRTLEALPLARRRAVARETMEVYAPLAHRLGIGKIQSELEDLAFYHLEPLEYRHTKHLLTRREAEQELLVKDAVEVLQKELEKAGLKAKVSGRSKTVYSIHRKMERYGQLGRNLDDIHDIIAIRVLVDKVEECYHSLGIIHGLWHPIGTEFNDYIATPKENGYRSLHTTVMCFNVPLEVQVRTYEMHESAEYGLSAHWVYKEGVKQDEFGLRIARLANCWSKEITGTAQFLELVKADIFQTRYLFIRQRARSRTCPPVPLRSILPITFTQGSGTGASEPRSMANWCH